MSKELVASLLTAQVCADVKQGSRIYSKWPERAARARFVYGAKGAGDAEREDCLVDKRKEEERREEEST